MTGASLGRALKPPSCAWLPRETFQSGAGLWAEGPRGG